MARDPNAPRTQAIATSLPETLEELPLYLQEELNSIWAAITAIVEGHMPKTHNAPDKPRDGDVRYADGTDWNPGSGEGAYIYYNSTWNKMG